MGGCASKPKEFDTTQPEAPPNESVSPQKAENTEEAKNSTNGDATSTNTAAEPSTEKTNEEAPLVDLSQPKEDEGEVSNVVTAEGVAPVVVPKPVPAPAAKAEAVAPAPTTEEKPKEETTLVADQVDIAAKQLAEVNLVEAAPKEEIAMEKEPAAPAAEPKPKVEEVAAPVPAEIKPTAASPEAPAVSEDKKTTTAANDAPPVTV